MSAEVPRRAEAAVEAAGERTRISLAEPRRPAARARAGAFRAFLLVSAFIGVAGLAALLIQSAIQGAPRLNLELLTNFPSSVPAGAGLQSAIVGSVMVIGGVFVIVVPLGVASAVYLEEYANKERWYNRLIEVNIQNLAAVPSIVFGILGLAFIVRGPLSLGFIAFAGSLTLAMLVLPTVILAAREAIRAVPDSIRQGALALGATKLQTVRTQVLPAAVPGIATGTILAMSRAIGETAPLLLVGALTFVTFNPPSPFSPDGYTTLPVQIFDYASRAQEEFRVIAAAGVIVMLAVLLSMNAFAIWVRNRYRKKQQW